MRGHTGFARSATAALFALLLATRLLMPAGFMPAFEGGVVTIVACPDEGPADAAMDAHHGGHPKKLHQPCPYASASGLGSLAATFAQLLEVLLIGAALLLGRTFAFLQRARTRDRPPLRGPPLLV